ncbi:unnamed protein product [Ceutorhynchus assimilis]|uniref:Uncharacterized protein n=1 Tax=Ceutorhynchus assimilis TaxID=467358 RepID=A0A9N9QNH3_9CUCU|nr:unnamed protein product [Ceutorhynchus assimilis]
MFFDLNQELLLLYHKEDNHQATTKIDGIDISAATLAADLNINKIKVIYLHKPPKCLAILEKLTKKHNELCHLADHLNDYMGIIIFLQLVSIIANIVWSLTVLFEYDIREVALNKINPPLIALICHIVYNLVWILSMMGLTIFIALVGRGLTQEGRNTSIYSYKILENQWFQAQDGEAALVKSQLILLAKQAETRCPVLSAAGFFVVDLEILGLVLANVFAFGIVAVQFVLNEH